MQNIPTPIQIDDDRIPSAVQTIALEQGEPSAMVNYDGTVWVLVDAPTESEIPRFRAAGFMPTVEPTFWAWST